jgi:hypothetical protein
MGRTSRTWLRHAAVAAALSLFTTPLATAQTRTPDQTPPPEQRAATVRVSDSLWNGAAIGAGTAIAGGLFLCTRTEPWRNCRDDVGPMVRIGALGAGIGMAVDALIRKRVDPGAASRRLDVAPILTKEAKGVELALTF